MGTCACEQKGQFTDEDTAAVKSVLDGYGQKEGELVHALQDVQHALGYLPKEAMEMIADSFNLSFAHIYGVASFYAHFYFAPRGKNIIKVCTGTACHVRGAKDIVIGLEEELGIEAGGTTDDMEFTLETVSCVGCCALAPVVVVNEEVVKEKKPKRIVSSVRGSEDDK